jgi:hypothetical protein
MIQGLFGRIKIQKLRCRKKLIQINKKMKIKKSLSILIIKDCLLPGLES